MQKFEEIQSKHSSGPKEEQMDRIPRRKLVFGPTEVLARLAIMQIPQCTGTPCQNSGPKPDRKPERYPEPKPKPKPKPKSA